MINQLTLGVGLKDEATFANFILEKNSHLIIALKMQPVELMENKLFIFFMAQAVKCTHLLQACCHKAELHHKSAVYIPLGNLTDFSPAFRGT